ncbi:flagellar motor switch phosphatase FliY [Paenibacillus sp. y28]|uniref:flagellar motor switch phosphatase FliY n=1 Tax=Paenibacillus sp. y28 TaxID=3129110 RepID=UPI003019EE5D
MTSKDYLSQEEIDALLKQSSDDTDDSGGGLHVDSYLSSLEQDALGEIGNITFGSAATALSTLLGKKVDITTPKVSVIAKEDLESEFPKPHVAVHVNYVDGFHGINLLVIKTKDAQVIADLMMGGDGTTPETELTEIHISAVQEAMNQMMGSSATSMSTIFNRFVNISPPGIDILDLSNGDGESNLPAEDVFIKVSFRLLIADLIDSSIMQLLPVSFAREMVSTLMGGGAAAEEPPVSQTFTEPAPAVQHQAPVQHQMPPAQPQQPPMMQPPYQEYAQPPMMPQQQYAQPPMYYQQPAPHMGGPSALNNRNVNVQSAQFASLSSGPSMNTDDTNLNLLLDIPLKVTVELGRTQKQIKEILELSQNSIIELDKLAGEPVDILVNNKLIAKGEVVVIDENFGVRVTDIVNQWDRIQKLQ